MLVCDYCEEEITPTDNRLDTKALLDAATDYHAECGAVVVAEIKKLKGQRPTETTETTGKEVVG